MKYDWQTIRNEYINGNISYRKLAEKHNVSFSSLQERAREEKWFSRRKVQHEKISEKVAQKTAEKIAEKQANFAVELQDTANELLEKVKKAVNETDFYVERTKLRVPKKVKDTKTNETYTAWQEDETVRLSQKDVENVKTLIELSNALKTLQTIAYSGKDEALQENPVINISVSAATPDDKEE